MFFDLLIRGGRLIDGSGAPGRLADVGVSGDRVITATGPVVAPGFVDPHGHSDSSVLIDGALASGA